MGEKFLVMMYKKSVFSLALVLTLATLLVAPFGVLADYPGALNQKGLMTGISNILSWVSYLFGVFAVITFFYAGFMFLSANGDSSKLKLARSAVLWGVVGIIVGLTSFGMVAYISWVLGIG